MERKDVIVIGAGPAGLSAAITLKIRNKSVLVIGNSHISKKVEKAHEIKNYLGLPDITGEELAQRFIDHAKNMGVEFCEEHIINVYAMGDHFALVTKKNEMMEAKSVILATGVNFGKPYQGEEQYLGRGVSYCATCDAPLYRNKKVIVIGGTPKEEEEVKFLAEVAQHVTYVPLYKDVSELEGIEIVQDIPVEIHGGMKVDKLILKNGEIEADGIFILRDNVSPAQLVPGLEMDGTHVKVNRKMETNLPGLLACGDIVGLPYQYIKSAGEGNIAAISAVEYLAKIK